MIGWGMYLRGMINWLWGNIGWRMDYRSMNYRSMIGWLWGMICWCVDHRGMVYNWSMVSWFRWWMVGGRLGVCWFVINRSWGMIWLWRMVRLRCMIGYRGMIGLWGMVGFRGMIWFRCMVRCRGVVWFRGMVGIRCMVGYMGRGMNTYNRFLMSSISMDRLRGDCWLTSYMCMISKVGLVNRHVDSGGITLLE